MFGVTGLQYCQIEQTHKNNSNSWTYRLNYFAWVFSWIIGHITGGVIFYSLLGWLGSFLFSYKFISFIGLGLLCIIAALQQFKVIQLPMPQIARQVSRKWLNNLHNNLVAFGYGFQLGTGVMTRIKTTTIYAVIGFAFCSSSIIYGAIIGGLFGFSRAILPVFFASQNTSPQHSLQFSLKFNSFDGKIKKINGVALFVSVLLLAFSLYFLQI